MSLVNLGMFFADNAIASDNDADVSSTGAEESRSVVTSVSLKKFGV